MRKMADTESTIEHIAVIGMAGRFPGAKNIHEFWDNLVSGKESITFFDKEEMQESGISTAELDNPNYVGAKGYMADGDCFDAAFFGCSPSEAQLMDPQHRILLETAYAALEDAGCNPERYSGYIGVFTSASFNTYLLHHLSRNPSLLSDTNFYQLAIANANDFLATRLSYKLNLQGPSQTIQTACSSSLVSIHHACQSILNYECDVALAGGVSITAPLKSGYMYKRDSIGSPDGHCRPFDAAANGTLAGNGCGVVVLKRLGDAIADHDRIYAIIKGSAINNDGGNKVGYTAPSVNGQAKVIQMAQAVANAAPETIDYIETHGTGTHLGDPIEIAALTRAFGHKSTSNQWCAIGSLKGNIGHLDVASGVTGFIKAALSIYHKVIPPTINFTAPNPEIEFEDTPFFVNTQLRPWEEKKNPRRAGVSAFGIGGTNAHVILEEAPKKQELSALMEADAWYILPISAKTPSALATMRGQFIAYLESHPDICLANVAYTMQTRRIPYTQREVLICRREDGRIRIHVVSHEFPIELIGDIPLSYVGYTNTWLHGNNDALSPLLIEENVEVISLPSYPFAKTSYWLPTAKNEIPASQPQKIKAASLSAEPLAVVLTKLLQSVLKADDVPMDESFDNIGVDSLMFIDYVLLIEQELKIKVPLAALSENDSITKLTSYIEKHGLITTPVNSNKKQLQEQLAITINAGNCDVPALFCIHPAGGSIDVFTDLARYIDPGQPIIGIRASRHDTTIYDMAVRYKKIIQELQPSGPYFFCGSSMGGMIALEIAQMLQKEGHNVPLLAMLDTPAPGVTFKGIIPDTDTEIMEYIAVLAPEIARDLSKMATANPEAHKQFLAQWRCHRDAVSHYQARPYAGNILFFRAAEPHQFQIAPFDQGWTVLVNDMEVCEVPGNHISMHFTPNVCYVSDVLNKKLQIVNPSNILEFDHAI